MLAASGNRRHKNSMPYKSGLQFLGLGTLCFFFSFWKLLALASGLLLPKYAQHEPLRTTGFEFLSESCALEQTGGRSGSSRGG